MFKLNYSALDVAGRYHNVCIIDIFDHPISLPGVTVDKSDAFMTFMRLQGRQRTPEHLK